MVLVSQIYKDSNGNEWLIQKNSLPKKRGEFIFWTGECDALGKGYREHTKKELKKVIEGKECEHEWSEPYGNELQCEKCGITKQTWEIQKFGQ